jgi:hypothetical protein
MTNQEAAGLSLAGLAALAWWLYRRTPAGQGAPSGGLTPRVTTSYGVDLGAIGGVTSYPEPIQNFARAIARQEGFNVAGSIPQRANNPGNLKNGVPHLPGTSITHYTSAGEGWAALHRQLYLILTGGSRYYTLDMSIEEMSRVWTATEQGPWARNVATFLGVQPSAPLWQVLA